MEEQEKGQIWITGEIEVVGTIIEGSDGIARVFTGWTIGKHKETPHTYAEIRQMAEDAGALFIISLPSDQFTVNYFTRKIH